MRLDDATQEPLSAVGVAACPVRVAWVQQPVRAQSTGGPR